jgi:hypothetical protein
MTDSMFMCLVFNNYNYENISYPRFYESIFAARIYATGHAKLHNVQGHLYINEARIYEINYDVDFDFDNMLNDHIEIYHSREVLAAKRIQKKYKEYIKRKMNAIIFLQYTLKRAIANPRTKLCQKRLLREFNSM